MCIIHGRDDCNSSLRIYLSQMKIVVNRKLWVIEKTNYITNICDLTDQKIYTNVNHGNSKQTKIENNFWLPVY